MNKFNIILILCFFISGCSNSTSIGDAVNKSNINITSEHNLISNHIKLEEIILSILDSESEDLDQLKGTWVHTFNSRRIWPDKISINVEEYKPLAIFNDGSFLTHKGNLIFPDLTEIDIELVNLIGSEDDALYLYYLSRDIQSQLNRLDFSLSSLELVNEHLLRAISSEGLVLVFSKKDFRSQIERLEDFISLELTSGKLYKLQNIDFRYNNAIAVKFS